MKNIIFDFGEVFVKVGTFISTLEKLDFIKNPQEFLEKYDDVIKKSFIDNTIDIYNFIQKEAGDKKVKKEEILATTYKESHRKLIEHILELSKTYNLFYK